MISERSLIELNSDIEGKVYFDSLHKSIYATDASVYRKIPAAVIYPKTTEDIAKIIAFAKENKTSIIPRTAGTSLAGQCVGEGIIVDVSKHFNRILHLDEKERTITVEPGVIRDELNQYLKAFGLFFGPNTSTSNRCMIGGMVGNNSSGTTSIQYGVTRDKVKEIEAVLSDGSTVLFKSLKQDEFSRKLEQQGLEGDIYRTLYGELSATGVREQIEDHFPKSGIHRRNTGYALDSLMEMQPFSQDGQDLNLCSLLAGSEGTLAFTTKIKLQLDLLPPEHSVMVAAHFDSISNCCKAVVPVMKHHLSTCEMMDKVILDCTKNNKTQLPNRFFIQGDPMAILMLELRADSVKELEEKRDALIKTLEESELSYAWPSLYGEDINKAMELRKAGLGLLGNIVGDRKAVACIEDTAVALEDLSPYIDEFSALMERYDQQAVYYAHAGAGELHLRPILNLKKKEDIQLFRKITTEVAGLVKKYKGSLSGEHGDGIVRGEFVEMMIGEENYNILKKIKNVFDPDAIFNRGKITDTAPMDTSLRYEADREEPEIETLMDFSDSEGILRAAEKCNGSGDCRKTEVSAGAMCPSYHATKDEKDTTRARANALREFLTNSDRSNRFDHPELKEVLDLCISCKACGSECPSNVDMATIKAEFLYQYHKSNKAPFRDRFFADNSKWNARASGFRALSNALFTNELTSKLIKKTFGIHPKRRLPAVNKTDFKALVKNVSPSDPAKVKPILFIDEFTRYLDTDIGKDAIELLNGLGYEVEIFYGDSGRSLISKGFLDKAKAIADKNVEALSIKIDENRPLIGIEPSAILSFRDEYLRLCKDKEEANHIAGHSLLIEEFLASEFEKGVISASQFSSSSKTVKIHNHCHQKALSHQKHTFDMLNIPENFKVSIINSGCCGMAGSFGYEKEHYEVSMKIGETRLFPAIRKSSEETVIAANGTSCRHQIEDGTKRKALHPVSILKEALK
ncbi:FAD-binding protein [Leptobacterium flavescens]|uniref:FAD-binding protein n=1 Tax=Leptobacterium flavescens TaxID=472055 RepID=A0A6P0UNI5_9FLAO|nr:FAD-binding and (Fe-S)-binding domain-containing protein [Leptobacterium flavescens]NER13409.1 FAD-binding protein [Leptobacterium flavescens]